MTTKSNMDLNKASRIAMRIVEQTGGNAADKDAIFALLVHIERLESERADAYNALPDSVSGDAAPESATLADRIRALAGESRQRLNGWRDAQKRVRELRAEKELALASLSAAAAGRREYAEAIPEDETNPSLAESRMLLLFEAGVLERAAAVVDGDRRPLYGWLPSWRWTDEMVERMKVGD